MTPSEPGLPPSEPPRAAPAVSGGDRRLHPLSWLFVLIQQLKQFALPLLVLLFTGRGNAWELWGLVGAGMLVSYSLLTYFTYRFRIEDDAIVIRSGVMQRTVRNIPFERIHNVALHQTLLHRLAGVAEVRLESAGGVKPEGEMRVLSLADAQILEELVRGHVAGTGDDSAGDHGATAPPRILLQLPMAEVVRLGLISNRGMIVVAAAFGLLAQTGETFGDLMEASARLLVGWAKEQHLDGAATVIGAIGLFVAAVLAMRILSVALALLQFHGFTLSESGRRLSAERGLLTRLRASLPRHRIQAWSLRETLLHRWFGRQSLRVDSANPQTGGDDRALRDLAPVAPPDTVNALIHHLLPGASWPLRQWHRLHPRAWRRQFTLPALLTLAGSAGLAWKEGLPGLWLLLLLPVWLLRARVWARHAGYTLESGLVAVREGWLDRRWRFAEVRKLQAVKLSRSPLDRWQGMATLWLDTAGASPFDMPLRIRYLPVNEALALRDRLAPAMEAPATPARTPA
ncbi:PH domain-containing protein [Arenimonas fontis]|uniref:PH domain-containing protein n=2 Tax=Arenimonas fontis TaxID=2608255 RepID=A0A5B2Z9T5_9GAMM|nr:PH domain-containing protein [Arenimonas fontis]